MSARCPAVAPSLGVDSISRTHDGRSARSPSEKARVSRRARRSIDGRRDGLHADAECAPAGARIGFDSGVRVRVRLLSGNPGPLSAPRTRSPPCLLAGHGPVVLYAVRGPGVWRGALSVGARQRATRRWPRGWPGAHSGRPTLSAGLRRADGARHRQFAMIGAIAHVIADTDGSTATVLAELARYVPARQQPSLLLWSPLAASRPLLIVGALGRGEPRSRSLLRRRFQRALAAALLLLINVRWSAPRGRNPRRPVNAISRWCPRARLPVQSLCCSRAAAVVLYMLHQQVWDRDVRPTAASAGAVPGRPRR